MEPALTFVLMAAGVLGASLMLDLAGAAVGAFARMGPSFRWPASARFAGFVTAVFVLSSLMRAGQAVASTPPPAHRIEHVGTSPVDVREHVPEAVHTATDGDSAHVVVEGECLWRIARHQLTASGVPTSGADISRLWRAIYAENRALIGDDPDLILPGQVLTIPGDLHGT